MLSSQPERAMISSFAVAIAVVVEFCVGFSIEDFRLDSVSQCLCPGFVLVSSDIDHDLSDRYWF
jgi:hypothetical protein